MKYRILALTTALILIGCSSNRSGSTEETRSDTPDWWFSPATSETHYYAFGQAKKQNPSLAKQTATARARTEISQAVNVKVASLLKDFMQESGIGDNAQATEFSQAVTKQVTNNSLQGSAIKEAYVAKDGTIYILVEYSLNSVRQNALDAAKKEEALYNEFKAKQGFDDLEKAISDLD